MSVATLPADLAAIDPRLSVEWIDGLCVIHGPKDLPIPLEVEALRLVEPIAFRFEWRPDVAA